MTAMILTSQGPHHKEPSEEIIKQFGYREPKSIFLLIVID